MDTGMARLTPEPDSLDRHVHTTPRTGSRDPRRHWFDAVVAAGLARR